MLILNMIKFWISLLQDVETKYWFDWIKGFNSSVNNTVVRSSLPGITVHSDKTNSGLSSKGQAAKQVFSYNSNLVMIGG